MSAREIPQQTVRAHELYGDYWFNSDPVPIAALRDRVVLIHFWDFSSSTCVRTIPYLKQWQKVYEPYGLTVIGVHRPRYNFARDPEVVFRAIKRLQISYPVVLDNQHLLSAQYDVRSAPCLLLVDRKGFVRYQCTGEGNYESTEQLIQRHLYEAGTQDLLPVPMQALREEDRQGAICYKATPDLLAGYLEGNVGNSEGLSPESIVDYADPGLYLEGKIYLKGGWMNGRDFFRLSDPAGQPGDICLKYQASEVHAVMAPGNGRPLEMNVLQDGDFLPEEYRGPDITSEAGGRTFIIVDEPRVYGLVGNPDFGEHTLRLSSSENGFTFYSVSFVTSVIPETISEG